MRHGGVAVCCSVLQCVAVCCGVLRCVVVCCGVCDVLRCVAVCCSVLQCNASWMRHDVLKFSKVSSIARFYAQLVVSCVVRNSHKSSSMRRRQYCLYLCVAVCGSVWECVGVCGSVWQCVAVCGSVRQCVAVCCSALQCVSELQCVAMCCSV